MDAASITGARNWDAVRIQHPDLVDGLAAGLSRGDPLADAAITELREAGLTFASVDFGRLDGLPALARLVESVTHPPGWFDAALADAGARAWWRFGTLQSSTLYQSLIYGYQAEGFVRPLAATGRLTDRTLTRVQETARWVAEATTPGSMAPGSPGWTSTLRIWLLHAMIRDHLIRDRHGTGMSWNVEEWGVPINQTYSAMTISGGFLTLPLLVARDFGIRYSSAEREAIAHLWRWIGWVIGVDDDLLPANYAQAHQLFTVATEFELEPAAASRVLTRALLRDGYEWHNMLPVPLPGPMISLIGVVVKPVLSNSFSAISTRWVADPVAAKLGLRRTPLHHIVDVARPAVRLREVIRTMGMLGSEARVVDRELRTVRRGLGMTAGVTSTTRPLTPTG